MKKYITPEFDTVILSTDVITASQPDNDLGDTPVSEFSW